MRLRKGLPPSVTGKVIFPKFVSFSRGSNLAVCGILLLILLAVTYPEDDTGFFVLLKIVFSILAYGTASLLLVSLLLREWSWRNTGFCSVCGVQVATRRLSWTPSWQIDLWCSGCGRLVNKDAVLVGSPELIDVEACADLPTPCPRLVGCLVMLALRSQADAITFFVEDDQFYARMIQGGETVQCDDLPLDLRDCISKVVQTMGGLEGESGATLTKEVRMQSQGAVVRARIVAEHFQTPEEKITIEFPDSTAAIAP